MKFRMFTDARLGKKVAINVDQVAFFEQHIIDGEATHVTDIWMTSAHRDDCIIIEVSEGFDTVFSRLNTIAE